MDIDVQICPNPLYKSNHLDIIVMTAQWCIYLCEHKFNAHLCRNLNIRPKSY